MRYTVFRRWAIQSDIIEEEEGYARRKVMQPVVWTGSVENSPVFVPLFPDFLSWLRMLCTEPLALLSAFTRRPSPTFLPDQFFFNLFLFTYHFFNRFHRQNNIVPKRNLISQSLWPATWRKIVDVKTTCLEFKLIFRPKARFCRKVAWISRKRKVPHCSLWVRKWGESFVLLEIPNLSEKKVHLLSIYLSRTRTILASHFLENFLLIIFDNKPSRFSRVFFFHKPRLSNFGRLMRYATE